MHRRIEDEIGPAFVSSLLLIAVLGVFVHKKMWVEPLFREPSIRALHLDLIPGLPQPKSSGTAVDEVHVHSKEPTSRENVVPDGQAPQPDRDDAAESVNDSSKEPKLPNRPLPRPAFRPRRTLPA